MPSSISLAAAVALFLATGPALFADDSVAQLIAKGDASDRVFKPATALQSYLPAATMDPDNVPLMLRISRQYRHLMTDARTAAEKERLGHSALAMDKRAAALAPNDSEAQLSQAITYGKMLPFVGKKEQIAASPIIKAAADRAIKLDPKNDNAWHVLGRWHQALANVSGLKRTFGEIIYGKLPTGTNAESIECFKKAIAINPNRLRHYIELGRTYAQDKQYAEARTNLQKGLGMPNKEKDDAEMKVRGREALAALP